MSSILIIYLRISLHKKKYLMLLLRILLQVIMSPHTPPFLWGTNCFYPVHLSIIKVCTCNYSYLDFVIWNSLRLFMLVYYVSPSNEGRHIVLIWFFLPLLPFLLSEACPDHNLFVFRDRSMIFGMWVHDHKAVCHVP